MWEKNFALKKMNEGVNNIFLSLCWERVGEKFSSKTFYQNWFEWFGLN